MIDVSANLTRAEFFSQIDLVRDDLKWIRERLEAHDGRVRVAETDLTRLREQFGSLATANAAPRVWLNRVTSSASAAAIVLLVQWLLQH